MLWVLKSYPANSSIRVRSSSRRPMVRLAMSAGFSNRSAQYRRRRACRKLFTVASEDPIRSSNEGDR